MARSQVTMIGKSTNQATPISLHHLQSLLSGGDSPQLFKLIRSPVVAEELGFNDLELQPDLPTLMADLLRKCQSLFQTPTDLPPRRVIDHQIHMVTSTKLINVRPYRYPYYQKTCNAPSPA